MICFPLNALLQPFIVLTVALVLTSSTEGSEANCSTIDTGTSNSLLVTSGNVDAVKTNTTETIANTVVWITCKSSSYKTNGSDVITCKNGTWIPPVPYCIPKTSPPGKPSTDNRTWYIVGGSAGGGVLLIIAVVIIILCFCRKSKNQSRHNKSDLEMSFIGQRWSNGMPDGISVVGSASQIGMTSSNSFYKVWSLSRSRKKLVKAENFKILLQKVGPLFGINGHPRLVLEEDGTEIDNDGALSVCADKIFIVLQDGQTWSNITSVKNNKPRLTFDICSRDRATRKLILANSLKDLLHQATICLDYQAECACLEEDGTMIDNDDSLFAFAGSTLMILGKGHDWKSPNSSSEDSLDYSKGQNKLSQLEIYNTAVEQTEDGKKMFKVWSKDERERKVVIANDLIDLHIKAAKLFGISPPVKISVHSEDTVIANDSELNENIDKTLIVSEASLENFPFVQRGSFDNPVFREEDSYPLRVDGSPQVYRNFANNPYSSRQTDRELQDVYSAINKGGKYGYVSATKDRRMQGVNIHDIEPSGLNRSIEYTRTGDRDNANFTAVEGRPNGDRFTRRQELNNLESAQFQNPSIIDQRFHNQPPYHFDHIGSRGEMSNYEYDNNSRSFISKQYMNRREPELRRPKSLENLALNPEISHQFVSHDSREGSLPYADLNPSHKLYQKQETNQKEENNFAVLRKTKSTNSGKPDKSKKTKTSGKREIDMSDYQGSYLATGGAEQSGRSDVYY